MNNDDEKNTTYNLDKEVNINKQNEEQYNNLIEHSKNPNDFYWDRNNPIVKFVLIGLFVVAVIGVAYYFIAWFLTK